LGEDGTEERELTYADKSTLASEAMLALVAGSDTTSTTLANAVFNLVSHPKVFAALRYEIDGIGLDGDEDVVPDPAQLAELKYLNAVINETLRLAPVLPCGGARTLPPSGGAVTIGDQ
jgi:cytochrome P450